MSKRVSIVALLATFMLLFTLLVPVGATLTPGPQPDDVNPFDDFVEHCQEYVSFVGDGSTIPDHSEIYGKTSFAGSFFLRGRVARAVYMGWWAIAVAETTTLEFDGDEVHVRWDFPAQRQRRFRGATADSTRYPPYTAFIEAAGELTWAGDWGMGTIEVTESLRHRLFTAVTAPQILALQASAPPGTPVYLVVHKGTNDGKQTAEWYGCLGTTVPFLRDLRPLLIPPAFPEGPFIVRSPVLQFGPTGWGGWSCPPGSIAVGGGTNPGATTQVAKVADPGDPQYPTYPHYTFSPGESGFVVQNDNDNEAIRIFVICT